MTESMNQALRRQAAFLSLETHLLKKAQELCRLGFTPTFLTPSQMATVTSLLQRATSLGNAKGNIRAFLERQIGKEKSVWQSKPPGDEAQKTLGDILREWLDHELYLKDAPGGELFDRLEAMRHFWGSIHGMYRYHLVVGEPMTLGEEPES